MICPRCGKSAFAHSMSWFNTEEICIPCQQDERDCPNYAKARQAECAAVRRGERHFPGLGLASEDAAYLEERRRNRQSGSLNETGDPDGPR